MVDDIADSAAQTAREIRVAFGRLRRRMREVASDDELTPSQASALARIAREEAATASALAATEGVRPQSMAAILVALEQAGLIRRTPDPADGRRSLVTLTDAGASVDGGNRAARAEWLTRALAERLTEDERRTVRTAMAMLERLVGE